MDFTNEISAFQGAIISADNVHQFSRITSKGGNEEKINFVIQSVKRFLLMEKYIDENGLIDTMVSTTRKFAMYIVLNADLPVLHDMTDITGIEPLIWSIPTVPKFLMCEMMWQLHMERFVYELIPNCWPQLGLEVAEAFLLNFKYFNPTECLNKLYRLSAASYGLICRLTCFRLQDDIADSTVTAVFEIFEKLLKYYTNPPNNHKLDVLSDDDLYKYKGKRLKSILFLVCDCCNMFSNRYTPNCDDSLYRSTYNEGYLCNTTYKVCESPNRLVVECLNNSNILLLDIFKEIVMDVSVDIFCAWSEFEEDGKSVQQGIGELCDKVLTKFQKITSISDHPVIPMIQMMARKPSKINDMINTCETIHILRKINCNDEESTAWIHALVYKENLFQDSQLIQVVKTNVNIFNDKESFKLYKSLKDSSISNNDENDLVNLKIRLFNNCNEIDKHRILKEQFAGKILTDTMISEEDFELLLNEIYNKFIVGVHTDYADVLTLFYQSPRKIYVKIFGLITQNTQLIEPMLEVMALLKDYTDYYYYNETEPCMIKVMKNALNNSLQTNYDKNIVRFICGLKNNDMISSSQLLMLVIMPGLHAALVNADITSMDVHVQLLCDAYTTEELLSYRAPMLVMMGQIMEVVRLRNLGTFQLNALHSLENTIRLQNSLINTYRDVVPDSEGSWLRKKVRELNLHPLNFYYFNSLWNVDKKSFFESVTGERIDGSMESNVLALQLTQVIPWAILEEWCEVWNNFIDAGTTAKNTLRLFHSAIDLLTQTIEANRTENSLACLLHCYRNLVHIIRYKFFKEPLTDRQVKTCVSLLSVTLSTTSPQDTSEIETIIVPLFAYLAEKKNEYTINIATYFDKTNYLAAVRRLFPNDGN